MRVWRPPGHETPLDAVIWLAVTLRGAPAHAPGPWTLTHERAFQDADRPYYMLRRVLAGSAEASY